MSKKEKVTETSQQKEEKIVTRYDRKMQKRKEQEAKDKREQKIARIVGIVIAAVLVCFIASFPIRNYIAVNETFVEIGGDKVTRVEFDYQYNMAISNYYSQYGSFLSYMGLDLSGDLSSQMYSDTLTWQDFFQEMAVNNIKQYKALLAEAKAAGFTYDASARLKQYEESLKDQAAEAGQPFGTYVKSCFGPYATMSRLKSHISDSLTASAYYRQLAEEKAPTEDEITAYYEENKDSYDSVDYRITQIDAELPTEPTELADPVEEDADAESSEEGVEGSEEEEAYEPSEAEIEAAMAEAKKKADAAEATVTAEGELKEGASRLGTSSYYNSWLFDASRKEGDTTVIEDNTNHRYYVLSFEKRYLEENPTVNARIIMTEDDPQAILEEWQGGAATEESFIELFHQYSTDTMSTEDGLYEGLTSSGLSDAMAEWLFAEGRVQGDATAIAAEEEGGIGYVIYYVGQGDVEWKLSIRSTLLNETLSEYLTQLSDAVEVNDARGNLNYLKIQAALEVLESAEEETEESAAESSSDEGETSTEASE